MAKLTYEERQRLPARDFVFPRERKYPIENAAHARNALARVSRFGSEYQKRKVCEAVARRWPSIHERHCPFHKGKRDPPRHHRHRTSGFPSLMNLAESL